MELIDLTWMIIDHPFQYTSSVFVMGQNSHDVSCLKIRHRTLYSRVDSL